MPFKTAKVNPLSQLVVKSVGFRASNPGIRTSIGTFKFIRDVFSLSVIMLGNQIKWTR